MNYMIGKTLNPLIQAALTQVSHAVRNFIDYIERIYSDAHLTFDVQSIRLLMQRPTCTRF